SEGQTVMLVAVEGRLAGLLGVNDPIRPSTPEAIQLLHDDGLRIIMLTGDSRKTAEAVARKLGIDEVIAEVLPQQKHEVVKRLQDEGHIVAMAGDGINDAPGLAAQDVQARMSKVPGVVDLQIEPQVEISQVRLKVRRKEAARYGVAPGDVAKLLETAYKGRVVSTVLDEDRYFNLVVWYDEASRNDPAAINKTILDTPSGRKVALGQVADVLDTTGPNTLGHEHVQRRI